MIAVTPETAALYQGMPARDKTVPGCRFSSACRGRDRNGLPVRKRLVRAAICTGPSATRCELLRRIALSAWLNNRIGHPRVRLSVVRRYANAIVSTRRVPASG